MNKPPSHKNEIKKLNRIAGQIEGIRKMIEGERHCPEILTQLRAARAAIRTLEASVLETHMQHCIADAIVSGNRKKAAEKINELSETLKRFDQ